MHAVKVSSFGKPCVLEIHTEAMSVAKDLKAHYLKLFEILLIVEERQLYFEFEVPSLHLYCVELLELSKDVAKDFIAVVRKSLEVPELAEAVRARKLTIPKARKICSVINESNHREWIELAIHCSCRVVEKAVAMANPKEAVQESLKYVSGEVLEFKAGVSEEWTELLARTKDLVSQKSQSAVSSTDAIFIAMAEFCKRNDPVEKAKRAEDRARKRMKANESAVAEEKSSALDQEVMRVKPELASTVVQELIANHPLEDNQVIPQSRHRPAEAEHIVNLRDQCQCVFVDANGKRCTARRWLNKHHIKEFAEGGDHRPENLETLCWAHHKIKHLKEKRPASRDADPMSGPRR